MCLAAGDLESVQQTGYNKSREEESREEFKGDENETTEKRKDEAH